MDDKSNMTPSDAGNLGLPPLPVPPVPEVPAPPAASTPVESTPMVVTSVTTTTIEPEAKTPVSPTPVTPPTTEAPKKKVNKKVMVGGLIVAILAVGVAVIAAFFPQFSGELRRRAYEVQCIENADCSPGYVCNVSNGRCIYTGVTLCNSWTNWTPSTCVAGTTQTRQCIYPSGCSGFGCSGSSSRACPSGTTTATATQAPTTIVPQPCTPFTYSCTGGYFNLCVANGSGYTRTRCPSGQCNAAGTECTPVTPTATPTTCGTHANNTRWCSGGSAWVCLNGQATSASCNPGYYCPDGGSQCVTGTPTPTIVANCAGNCFSASNCSSVGGFSRPNCINASGYTGNCCSVGATATVTATPAVSCGSGYHCVSTGGTACINGGGEVDGGCYDTSGHSGTCCAPNASTIQCTRPTCVGSYSQACVNGHIGATTSCGTLGCNSYTGRCNTVAVSPTPSTTTSPAMCTGCGGNNQSCCDQTSCPGQSICGNGLYCHTELGYKCTTSPLVCGSATVGASPNCAVYKCGTKCNNGNQCDQGGSVVPCSSASLGGQCGQIDFLDNSGAYCGVKTQNCFGSCTGTTPTPGTGTPGSGCPYSSTQVQVQRNASIAWMDAIPSSADSNPILPGQTFRIGGFHNGTGVLTNNVNVQVKSGTTVISTAQNPVKGADNVFTFTVPANQAAGTLTILGTTQGQTGANCQDQATVTIGTATTVTPTYACVGTRIYLKQADGTLSAAIPNDQLSSQIKVGSTIVMAVRGNLATFAGGQFVIKLNNSVLGTYQVTASRPLTGDPATKEFTYEYTITQPGSYEIDGAVSLVAPSTTATVTATQSPWVGNQLGDAIVANGFKLDSFSSFYNPVSGNTLVTDVWVGPRYWAYNCNMAANPVTCTASVTRSFTEWLGAVGTKANWTTPLDTAMTANGNHIDAFSSFYLPNNSNTLRSNVWVGPRYWAYNCDVAANPVTCNAVTTKSFTEWLGAISNQSTAWGSNSIETAFAANGNHIDAFSSWYLPRTENTLRTNVWIGGRYWAYNCDAGANPVTCNAVTTKSFAEWIGAVTDKTAWNSNPLDAAFAANGNHFDDFSSFYLPNSGSIVRTNIWIGYRYWAYNCDMAANPVTCNAVTTRSIAEWLPGISGATVPSATPTQTPVSNISKVSDFMQVIAADTVTGKPKQTFLSADGTTIYDRFYDNNAWGAWTATPVTSLGISGVSAVRAVSQAKSPVNNQIKYEALTTDGKTLYTRYYTNNAWGAWTSAGLSINGADTFASFNQGYDVNGTPTQTFLSADGTTLYNRSYQNGAWGAWTTVTVVEIPGMAPLGVNAVRSFQRSVSPVNNQQKQEMVSLDGTKVYTRLYQNGTWQSFTTTGVSSLAINGADSSLLPMLATVPVQATTQVTCTSLQAFNAANTELASNATVAVGDSVTYQINYKNNSTSLLSGVAVADSLPPGLSLTGNTCTSVASATNVNGNLDVACKVPNLEPSAQANVRLTVQVTSSAGASIVNNAWVNTTGQACSNTLTKASTTYTCTQTAGQICVTGSRPETTCVSPSFMSGGTGTCATGQVCCLINTTANQ